MARAGEEPAEDVKRASRRAIVFASLDVCTVRMVKMDQSDGRWVVGTAKPTWWKHELPAMEVSAVVKFSGEVGPVDIRCAACDNDPIAHVFDGPHLQHGHCSLAKRPQVLKEVWAARGSVLQRWRNGELPPFQDGRWTWAQAVSPS